MTNELYVVKVAVRAADDPIEDEPPTLTAWVDASNGDPVITEVTFTGPKGASVMQAWDGLEAWTSWLSSLPKRGTALQLDEPITRDVIVAERAPLADIPEPKRFERRECPRCHRTVAVDPVTSLLVLHNDKAHNGKRCPVGKAQPLSGTTKGSKRGAYRTAPDNVLDLLEQHDGSVVALAEAQGVPRHTVAGWVKRARAKVRREPTPRENVKGLPIQDDFSDLARVETRNDALDGDDRG